MTQSRVKVLGCRFLFVALAAMGGYPRTTLGSDCGGHVEVRASTTFAGQNPILRVTVEETQELPMTIRSCTLRWRVARALSREGETEGNLTFALNRPQEVFRAAHVGAGGFAFRDFDLSMWWPIFRSSDPPTIVASVGIDRDGDGTEDCQLFSDALQIVYLQPGESERKLSEIMEDGWLGKDGKKRRLSNWQQWMEVSDNPESVFWARLAVDDVKRNLIVHREDVTVMVGVAKRAKAMSRLLDDEFDAEAARSVLVQALYASARQEEAAVEYGRLITEFPIWCDTGMSLEEFVENGKFGRRSKRWFVSRDGSRCTSGGAKQR